jgi:hypothetical protein
MTEQLLDTPVNDSDLAQRERDAVIAPMSTAEPAGWSSTGENTFDYVPVSPWGPIALILGVMSLSGFVGLFGLIVALASSIVGVVAIARIRAESGFVKGRWMAVTGIVLSFASLTLGSTKMAWDYSTECPDGYTRVSFPKDIAAKQFIYLGSMRKLHPEVARFVHEKVFLKGFMWQTRDTDGITGFVLLKDNGECCFGGKAQPYDMMWITLQDGQTTKAYTGMVSVAGTLTVNLEAAEDEAVYRIDGAMVEEARTAF